MSRRRVVMALAMAAAVAIAASFQAWVVTAPVHPDSVGDADAVVMFVGGRGERLEAALALMDAGVAPVLVIPNGNAAEWPQGNAACMGEAGYDVLCPEPEPDNTRGEAQLIAGLAAELGWERIVYVTSDFHSARAGRLLAFCFNGEVDAAPAGSDLSLFDWLRRGVKELAGNISIRTIDRGC